MYNIRLQTNYKNKNKIKIKQQKRQLKGIQFLQFTNLSLENYFKE